LSNGLYLVRYGIHSSNFSKGIRYLFTIGYDQGVFSGIVTNANWKATFGNPNSSLEGIIVSIYNLGAFTGTIINFFLGEKLGRRKSMWFAMTWIIIGAILQASSYSVAQIMVARFVTGIGTGIETSTVPMYQSELVEAERRGRVVSSEPLFVGVGIVIAYFFDFGLSFVGGPIAWRLPIACQVIFAIVSVHALSLSLSLHRSRTDKCRLSSLRCLAFQSRPDTCICRAGTRKRCKSFAMCTTNRQRTQRSKKNRTMY